MQKVKNKVAVITGGSSGIGLATAKKFVEEAAGAKAYFAGITPLGRVARPEEMASTILFLASEDSSYITGADIAADGGLTQV